MVRLVPIEKDIIPNGSIGEQKQVEIQHVMRILRSISHLYKTTSLLLQVETR